MIKKLGLGSLFRRQVILLAVISFVLVAAPMIPSLRGLVAADKYDDQINDLKQQNASIQGTVDGLVSQASSYQDSINKLQQQINGLQSSINANQAQQASLQQQIEDAEAQIVKQKAFLASDIKAMYVDGTPSTLEMLATSKSLSSFVDKQEYRSSVQNKLQATLNEIAALKEQLNTKKASVDQLLSEEKSQQDQLAGARSQQAGLLSYNQSQQDTYNQQMKANDLKVTQLRAEAAAANRRGLGSGSLSAGDPNHGGYPGNLANSYMDSLTDPWGMYNRECVSYTAWKVYQTYGYMPYWGGIGNAWQWAFSGWQYSDGTQAYGNYTGTTWHTANADAAGIPTGSEPRANSVAIWNNSRYGHAMWVEAVYGDGSILVSQYNFSYNGTYSEWHVPASTASTFRYIYFH
ncbi:MAG: CHAP domain-containing protein [Candidatus Saccharimonadales bacterium]